MKTHRSSFWATGVLLAAGAALYAQQAAEAPATDRRLQTRPAVAGLHLMVPLGEPEMNDIGGNTGLLLNNGMRLGSTSPYPADVNYVGDPRRTAYAMGY